MRMVVAHHLADDGGALAVLRVREQTLAPHGVKDAPLNRLQAVPHVRQRAARDDRQRVVEVTGLRDVVERRQLLGVRREDDGRIAIAPPPTTLARTPSTGRRRAAFTVRTRLR